MIPSRDSITNWVGLHCGFLQHVQQMLLIVSENLILSLLIDIIIKVRNEESLSRIPYSNIELNVVK